MYNFLYIAALLLAATIIPEPAHAYIGPGAGLSVIGTLVAVIGAFLLLIVGFVWYPVKRLLGRKKASSVAKNGELGNGDH